MEILIEILCKAGELDRRFDDREIILSVGYRVNSHIMIDRVLNKLPTEFVCIGAYK